MYPRLSDIFSDVFGFDFPMPIYSFGAMVAIAVLTAAWLLRMELDRMYRAGRLPAVRVPDEEKGKRKRSGTVQRSPAVLVGTITILALVSGFAGAKLFHILENLPDFFSNPMGMVFSTGGFTFYGGLLVAAGTLAWYARKYGLHVWTFADAVAPGLMIAYGIGRIGCHLAGDGDWGIASDLSSKPGWVPTWLWAETYPNNILNVDLAPPGVYPTPIYEFLMAGILFGVLWSLRRHPFLGGWLFSLYLVFAGIERFLIEQIRVNNTFEMIGLVVTQAEVISVCIILAGVIGLVLTTRKRSPVTLTAEKDISVASTPI